MNTSIHVDAGSVVARATGPATGELWLTIDGNDFPAPHWNDFIVVVLMWWTSALLRLLGGTSERELVHFMDGPYAVEISSQQGRVLRFRALEGSKRDRERAVGEQFVQVFLEELVSQANEVLDSCREQNWSSSDAEQLRASITSLQELSRALGPN